MIFSKKHYYFLSILLSLIIIPFASCDCDKNNSSEDAPVEVEVEIIESTNENLDIEIGLPPLEFVEVETEQFGNFKRIKKPSKNFKLKGGGNGSGDSFSKPEVPILLKYVALPIGETLKASDITITYSNEDIHKGIRLYPTQKPRRDHIDEDDDEAFDFNETIYKDSEIKIGDVSVKDANNDSASDTNIWEVKLNLVEYDPQTETLHVPDSVSFSIKFPGDTSCYSQKRDYQGDQYQFEQMDKIDEWIESLPKSLNKSVINEELINNPEYTRTYVFQPVFEDIPVFRGAHLIIITHPDFRTAADTLKEHKISRGINSYVIETGSDFLGTTDIEIKNYLQVVYENWMVRPKWVLLIGDAEFIPTHYTGYINTWDPAENSGDMFYGQFGSGDTSLKIPVFGIGRLPVDTIEEANDLVNKIIEFENNPPGSPIFLDNSYYYTLTFAAEFQDVDDDHPIPDGRAARWFAETSEHIRNYLLTEDMEVTRIYKATPYNCDPQFWYDGTPLPLDLQKPTFAWDGDKYDIFDAVNNNNGTSILYHRDHGAYYGWGTPSFDTDDLSSINVTDNEFPVVYSINCSSGFFDNETAAEHLAPLASGLYWHSAASLPTLEIWAEEFIKKTDGAIALICDTRGSSTVLNNDLAKGLFDATWTDYLHYGSSTPIRKLGDVLNHAKGYVKYMGYDDDKTRQELNIYNLLGDPTMEVKSSPPMSIMVQAPVWRSETMQIDIPIQFLNTPKQPCYHCPPIIAVAFDDFGNEIGRTILMNDEIKDENTLGLQLDHSNTKQVRLVISGADIKTETTVVDL
ncbi:MAG: C25 family cysteine peptidase [Spirochaetota bacterium]|nr:C25 family cysteine peptidase [Spirochaetota bacterium]